MEAARLGGCMRTLWGIPWDNIYKETLWRLTVNGVAGAGGHGIVGSRPCPCGWSSWGQAGSPGGRRARSSRRRPHAAAGPAQELDGVGTLGTQSPLAAPVPAEEPARDTPAAIRAHYFWGCPVAAAVVAELQRWPGLPPLTCADVWLLRAPPGVHSGVWALACMAAVHAMERGRRALWHQALSDHRGEARDPNLVSIASKEAVVLFWCLLQDLADLQSVPNGWTALPPDHPFFGVTYELADDGSEAGPRLALRLPMAFTLPADLN